MLDILAGSGLTPRFEQTLEADTSGPVHLVSRSLLRSAHPTLNLKNPSGLFYQSMRRLHKILEPEQRASRREWDVDERIRISESAARELEVARRLVYALPHETAILQFLHRRVLEDLNERIRKLRTSAELRCELLDDIIIHKQMVKVRFRLKNIGLVTAQDIEVTLKPSASFQLGDESPVKRIDDLGPNQVQDIVYSIEPRDERLLRLSLAFQGHTDGEKHTFLQKEFRLRVQSPSDSKPFTRKPNPYIYGPPIRQSDFFYGHQAEVQNLLDILYAGGKQNVLVRGPRRTGKTSLLFMVRSILSDEGGARARFNVGDGQARLVDLMHPLYLDLQETREIVSHEPSGEFGHIVGPDLKRVKW